MIDRQFYDSNDFNESEHHRETGRSRLACADRPRSFRLRWHFGYRSRLPVAGIAGAQCLCLLWRPLVGAFQRLAARYRNARQFFDPSLRDVWRSASHAPYDFLVQSTRWKLGAISIPILRRQFDKTYVTAAFDNQGRAVTMNFILVQSPDGWVIHDVESPHDSLRAFLAQYRH